MSQPNDYDIENPEMSADKDIEKIWDDLLEENKSLKPKISVLHPTLRPVQAMKVYYDWFGKAKDPERVEWLFGIDEGDEGKMLELFLLIYRECFQLDRGFQRVAIERVRRRHGANNKVNCLAAISRGEILVFTADDSFAPLHWDALIEEKIGDTSKEVVLDISDGVERGRRNLLRGMVMTRRRYERMGYVGHPAFFHLFADDWFSMESHRDGVVRDAKDIVFRHDHPLFTGKRMDGHYERLNEKWRYDQGRAIFEFLECIEKEVGPQITPISQNGGKE